MDDRKQLGLTNKWVVKVGSTLLTDEINGLNTGTISSLVTQIVKLKQEGVDIILVSSGAVAEGMMRMKWSTRPHALHQLQAAAAIGQMGLIQAYESSFQQHGLHTAQILLTHDDLANRKRYLNARSTLRELLKLGVIPVVNENDTVAMDEIRFGDNDRLAGLVANLIEADLLILLTDQTGMFDKDPRKHKDATLINEAQAGDRALETMATGTHSQFGCGGMLTKVIASKLASRSGTATIIASGKEQRVLERIRSGESVGTLIKSGRGRLLARKRWLASHLQSKGKLTIDAGAVKVLRQNGRSLLAVGVTQLEGNFARGEAVVCIDTDGQEVACGLINYNAEDARKIIGKASDKIESILGYVDEPELIHRDNLVLL